MPPEPSRSAGAGGDAAPDRPSVWIRSTIHRPVGVLVAFLAVLVVGGVTWPRIRTEMLPGGLSGAECGVYIPVRDGTPREVMEQVARPTEDLLRTLPGLESIVSTSGSNRCFIRMVFDSQYDLGVMVAEVRDRLERARPAWPDAVDDYRIWRQGDSDLPAYIASMGIEVQDEEVDLDWIFEEVIRRRVERLPGVARVDIWGTLEKRVEVELDRDRVGAYGVDLRRLVERLGATNTAVTAGRVSEGDREYSVRIDGRFQGFEELRDWPVNRKFRIDDVAEVGYRTAVRDRLSRVNGQLSRVLVVSKESGANAVEVCDRVRREVEDLEATLRRTVPGVGSVESHAWLDQGRLIRSSVNNLSQSALFGGACAVAVLFLFLRRVGMTLLITLAIPSSLLITVIWLYFSGGTYNLLSLMGFSLAIGMLVDNSIVVVENILRQLERGLSYRQAAIEGVREVGLAVALATLTTVMVLLPIFFLGDVRFKKLTTALGGPLCVSVLASLLVALVFIPQGAMVLSRGRVRGAPGGAGALRTSRANRATCAGLAWCLRHRFGALVGAGLLLASSFLAFSWLPKSDLSLEGPHGIELRLELPQSFTLSEANDTFARVEKALRESSERHDLGVASITSFFDSRGGELRVFFEAGRRAREQEFFETVRPGLPQLPGLVYHFGHESFARNQGRQRIRVFLTGNDYDALRDAEEIVRRALENPARFPELGEVARWSEDQRSEVRVEISRRAAQFYGVDTALVSRMVSWALRGAPLPDFVRGEREYPFWVGYDDAQKESVGELDSILIPRPGGEPVRLENLAAYELRPGSGEIHRRDGKLTAGLSASVRGEVDTFRLRSRIERELRRLRLPESCEISMRPPSGGFEEDMRSTGSALLMAMSLVFCVMGLLFESWLLPLSVLFCVPFAFFGSVWLLLISGVRLDAVGMIGVLMLVGIVVNNAIVLVDYINRLRVRGLPRRGAILEAVCVRFRPIWMTALTTIFGLLPLAVLEPESDSVDYRALAVVIIGGLATSTFFTLLVVPTLYTLLDDLRRLRRAFASARADVPAGAEPTGREGPGGGAA